ncbi:hypothetical protein QM012_006360 [Aureobasidium pullulans]|uniref:DUF659 domain-containing protein n=1 Tax=Aureobasidium pullulans TaxID=5580 RepID=A0ABR0T4C0_AURPU
MATGGRPQSGIGQQFHSLSGDLFDCNWCFDWKTKNKNNSRRETHLLKCPSFLQAIKDPRSAIDIDLFDGDFRVKVRQKVGNEEASSGELAAQMGKQELDRLAAMTIYRGGLPFNTYQQNPDLLKLFKALNPALNYKPPGRDRLAGPLLDECSGGITSEVKKLVLSEEWINVITDESGAQNHDRVINLSVNTAIGQAFFIESFNAGENTVSGEWLRTTITQKVKELVDGNLGRWNSICTDTCAAQRTFHAALQEHPSTSHVFCVLCDNHGIQLALKDICDPDFGGSISFYSSLIREVNMVLSFFRSSDKLWQMLLRIAGDEGEKLTAFIRACITRWGSYYDAVDGLRKNKSVMRTASLQGVVTNPEVKKLVDEEAWWMRIESLRALIQPIHMAQLLSENDRSTVGMVIPRWQQLRAEIGALNLPCKEEVLERLDERMAIQTTDIHHAAYLLNCQIDRPKQTKEDWYAAARFFNTHVSEDDFPGFWGQLADYFARAGVFARAELWKDPVRFQPQAFWMLASKFGAIQLAKIGSRLAITPANSVPSERSFSAMNYIQNNFRAKMSTKVTSKLCNVYMNSRSLDKRKELITNDWIQQQIMRRVERHKNQRLATLEDIKIAQQERDTRTLDDLIDEAADIIPAAKAALASLSFPQDDLDRVLMPPPPVAPEPILPDWVVLPSVKQHPSKKQPQPRQSRKRKAPSETPQTPRTRSKTPQQYPQLPTPQTQPTQSTQSQYWAPPAPLRTPSPFQHPPSSQLSFSIGSSAPAARVVTPSQQSRVITSTMSTQETHYRAPLGELNNNSQYAQLREVFDLTASSLPSLPSMFDFSQNSENLM